MTFRTRGRGAGGGGGITAGISGATTSGATLTAVVGTLPAGSAITGFAWKRDGVAISGATASTYVVQAGDVGHVISCVVGLTTSATGIVYIAPPVAPVLPAGVLMVGGQPLYINGQPLALA